MQNRKNLVGETLIYQILFLTLLPVGFSFNESETMVSLFLIAWPLFTIYMTNKVNRFVVIPENKSRANTVLLTLQIIYTLIVILLSLTMLAFTNSDMQFK